MEAVLMRHATLSITLALFLFSLTAFAQTPELPSRRTTFYGWGVQQRFGSQFLCNQYSQQLEYLDSTRTVVYDDTRSFDYIYRYLIVDSSGNILENGDREDSQNLLKTREINQYKEGALTKTFGSMWTKADKSDIHSWTSRYSYMTSSDNWTIREYEDSNLSRVHSYSFQNGRLRKYQRLNASGDIDHEEIYNEAGYLVQRTDYDPLGQMISLLKAQYTPDNRVTEVISYDVRGQVDYRASYKYLSTDSWTEVEAKSFAKTNWVLVVEKKNNTKVVTQCRTFDDAKLTIDHSETTFDGELPSSAIFFKREEPITATYIDDPAAYAKRLSWHQSQMTSKATYTYSESQQIARYTDSTGEETVATSRKVDGDWIPVSQVASTDSYSTSLQIVSGRLRMKITSKDDSTASVEFYKTQVIDP
jgi:hypothetical protein